MYFASRKQIASRYVLHYFLFSVEIVQEAVEIEIEFLTDALPVKLIGMNHELMATYIK